MVQEPCDTIRAGGPRLVSILVVEEVFMRWQIVLGLTLILAGLLVRSAFAQGVPEPVEGASVEAEEPAAEEPAAEEEEPAAEEPAAEEEEPAAEEPAAEQAAKEKKQGAVVLKRSTRPPRERGPFTVLGAAALDREDTALRIAVGYPEVHAVYHMPWDTDIEFGVGGGFFYGFNANSTGDVYGGKFIGEGRWRFFKDGQHSLALVANPALELGSGYSDFVGGLTIGFPGIVYDYAIKNENHAILGFSMPFGFYASKVDGEAGFATRIPLVLKAGMEFELTDLVHLFISFEMGADIWTGDVPLPDGEGVYLFTRGLTGAGVIL